MGFVSKATKADQARSDRAEQMARAREQYGTILRAGDPDMSKLADVARLVYPTLGDEALGDRLIADMDVAPEVFRRAAELAEQADQHPELCRKTEDLEKRYHSEDRRIQAIIQGLDRELEEVRQAFLQARAAASTAHNAHYELKQLRAQHSELFAGGNGR